MALRFVSRKDDSSDPPKKAGIHAISDAGPQCFHFASGFFRKVRCKSHGIFPKTQKNLWLVNIAMENGPFIDGLPMFTY